MGRRITNSATTTIARLRMLQASGSVYAHGMRPAMQSSNPDDHSVFAERIAFECVQGPTTFRGRSRLMLHRTLRPSSVVLMCVVCLAPQIAPAQNAKLVTPE